MSLKYWSYSAFGHLPALGLHRVSACGESRTALVPLPQPAVTADVKKRFRAKSFAGELKLKRRLSRAGAGLGKRGWSRPESP